MADSIWWTKMLHKDFCAHYCEMSDSEIVADVRRSVASLMMQRSEGSDFGALMVRMAMQRIKEKHDTAVSFRDTSHIVAYIFHAPKASEVTQPQIDYMRNYFFRFMQAVEDGDTSDGSQGTRTAAAITRNEPLENDPLDTSSTISAGAPTSEDGEDRKSGTPTTIYGDAESGDASEATTTISDNMRRVPQNGAPAHGFSGGRTAHGTMSRSPEADAQSGKSYDQGTDRRISTE